MSVCLQLGTLPLGLASSASVLPAHTLGAAFGLVGRLMLWALASVAPAGPVPLKVGACRSLSLGAHGSVSVATLDMAEYLTIDDSLLRGQVFCNKSGGSLLRGQISCNKSGGGE